MKYLIGVDVGSTFTDVVCAHGSDLEYVKLETTPHDLTVCFMEGIKKCVSSYGEVEKVLGHSEPVRWSSTVATNIIAMKKGSPVGLIVTKGYKDLLIQQMDIAPFIATDLLVELDEEVDEKGTVVKSVQEEELIKLVEDLLDKGARVLAISLHNSSMNTINERKAKQILYTEYPEYYLGCTETLLASEITSRPDYFKRTITALLDAYVHHGLVKFLYKGDEVLSQSGARYPMFIVQTTGGMARAAKTVAVNTIGAGPTASLSYTSLLARLYNEEPLIVFEVGGATSNCSIGRKQGGTYRSDTEIEGLPLYLFSPDVTSIGLGGGTIIRLRENKLEVGPESAGSVPGPACYDLGNEEPTICDVNLVLGIIDPDYYEGGSRNLLKDLAVEALRPPAEELGVTVEELCLMVRKVIRRMHFQLVMDKTAKYGISPVDCTMVVCGGEGPVHVCGVADLLGVKKIIIPQNSATFGAVGCVLMDVVSMYETYSQMTLWDKASGYFSDHTAFNKTVDRLKKNIFQDMKAQGSKVEEIDYQLELEVEDAGGSFRTIISCSRMEITGDADVEALCRDYKQKYLRVKGLEMATDEGIRADIIRLKGVQASPAWQPVMHESAGENAENARKGSRKVLWQDSFEETDIYQGEKLNCGNVINGPAIVEEKYTTIVIPAGWKCLVDKCLNKILSKV